MPKKLDILAAFFTISGSTPVDPISRFTFRERVEEAAAAGFSGIGFWHVDLEHLLTRHSAREMKQIMDDHGFRCEVEYAMGIFNEPESNEQTKYNELILTAGEKLGATHLKAGDPTYDIYTMDQMVEGFSKFCARANDHGMKVGYELLPISSIDSVDTVMEMIQRADAPNGGILLDSCHTFRLGIPIEKIASLPVDRIIGVELCDGWIPPSTPDLFEEAVDHRQLCGEGDMDIRGYVKALLDAGFAGPWSVEIMSKELRTLPLPEMAKRSYETTAAQFR